MKAFTLHSYGTTEVLSFDDVDKPSPRSGEVLVRIYATTINDWDYGFMRGIPRIYRLFMGLFRPNVSILGTEIAGVVEAVGEGVDRFALGDHVYGDVSEAGFGGYAEYVSVKQEALAKMSPQMSFEQAVTLPHAGCLAVQALIDYGQLKQGEKVLINGAGGGVGVLGVQIAKRFGAHVTGVDKSSKLVTLREEGFDEVIDYRTTDFVASGEKYDVIVDTKSTRSPFRIAKALKPGGRYATVGGTVPRLLQILLLGPLVRRLTGRKIQIVPLKTNKDLPFLADMFEEQKLKGRIDGPFPLRELKTAMDRFGEANHIGKVVVSVLQPSSEPRALG